MRVIVKVVIIIIVDHPHCYDDEDYMDISYVITMITIFIMMISFLPVVGALMHHDNHDQQRLPNANIIFNLGTLKIIFRTLHDGGAVSSF